MTVLRAWEDVELSQNRYSMECRYCQKHVTMVENTEPNYPIFNYVHTNKYDELVCDLLRCLIQGPKV